MIGVLIVAALSYAIFTRSSMLSMRQTIDTATAATTNLVGTVSSRTPYHASSTSYYHGPNAACGGAHLPTVRNKFVDMKNHGDLDMDYFPVAVSIQMMEGPGKKLPCDVGPKEGAGYNHVMHVTCGQCIKYTIKSGEKDGHVFGGVVMDTCKHSGNEGWCMSGGKPNKRANKYNHIDVFGPTKTGIQDLIGDNPIGEVEIINCPHKLNDAMYKLADANNPMKGPICNWYYEPPQQGAYGMQKWGCAECH